VESAGVECPKKLLGVENLPSGGKKMKKIQILGTGCPKCMKLTANAQEAAKQAGVEFEIEKVTEINKIMNFGVMMTPALAIDGEVKSVGKVLSPEEIKKLL
jgi:small redox-active disulfide protein 2